uniref:Uncharacterized protein n=1 Tax=Avena sativa TaxID=4498 RepID=A0ACD5WQZ6_AVESA
MFGVKSDEPAAPRTLKVKMDGSHKFIQWLLEWDKKPRLPLPNTSPEPLCDAFNAFKAFDEESEKVLKEYKLHGYAIVEVDVLDDDDPKASMDDDQYDLVDAVEEPPTLSHL